MNNLLSILFSLAIGGMALYFALPMLLDAQMQPAQNDAGNQIAVLQAATINYILGHAATDLAAVDSTQPTVWTSDAAHPFPAGLLPPTFQDWNVFGQHHAVAVIQPTAGQFEALVYTYGGDTMTEGTAIRVAQAGPPNSIVYLASDPAFIEGAAGGEKIDVNLFQNGIKPITVGHIGAHILRTSLAAEAPFLNRYATGNLDDNTMHTAEYMDGNDLDMGGGNVKAAKAVEATQQVKTPTVVDPGGNYQITMAGTSKVNVLTADKIYSSDYLHTSDASLKTNIHRIEGALDLIKSMQGKRFQWIEGGSPSIGFIAQDVERTFPEAVKRRPDGKLAVEYDIIAAPLVEAVKELSDQVDELRNENELLAGRRPLRDLSRSYRGETQSE